MKQNLENKKEFWDYEFSDLDENKTGIEYYK
jgi:hypothetical protein